MGLEAAYLQIAAIQNQKYSPWAKPVQTIDPTYNADINGVSRPDIRQPSHWGAFDIIRLTHVLPDVRQGMTVMYASSVDHAQQTAAERQDQNSHDALAHLASDGNWLTFARLLATSEQLSGKVHYSITFGKGYKQRRSNFTYSKQLIPMGYEPALKEIAATKNVKKLPKMDPRFGPFTSVVNLIKENYTEDREQKLMRLHTHFYAYKTWTSEDVDQIKDFFPNVWKDLSAMYTRATRETLPDGSPLNAADIRLQQYARRSMEELSSDGTWQTFATLLKAGANYDLNRTPAKVRPSLEILSENLNAPLNGVVVTSSSMHHGASSYSSSFESSKVGKRLL